METLNQRKHWIEPESLNKAKYKGVSTSSPLQVQELLMTSNNQKSQHITVGTTVGHPHAHTS